MIMANMQAKHERDVLISLALAKIDTNWLRMADLASLLWPEFEPSFQDRVDSPAEAREFFNSIFDVLWSLHCEGRIEVILNPDSDRDNVVRRSPGGRMIERWSVQVMSRGTAYVAHIRRGGALWGEGADHTPAKALRAARAEARHRLRAHRRYLAWQEQPV